MSHSNLYIDPTFFCAIYLFRSSLDAHTQINVQASNCITEENQTTKKSESRVVESCEIKYVFIEHKLNNQQHIWT